MEEQPAMLHNNNERATCVLRLRCGFFGFSFILRVQYGSKFASVKRFPCRIALATSEFASVFRAKLRLQPANLRAFSVPNCACNQRICERFPCQIYVSKLP